MPDDDITRLEKVFHEQRAAGNAAPPSDTGRSRGDLSRDKGYLDELLADSKKNPFGQHTAQLGLTWLEIQQARRRFSYKIHRGPDPLETRGEAGGRIHRVLFVSRLTT